MEAIGRLLAFPPFILHDSGAMPERTERRRLTPKQAAVLDFIRQSFAEQDRPPTLNEIQKHFRLNWKKNVVQFLWALESKGYIATTVGVRGSLRLID